MRRRVSVFYTIHQWCDGILRGTRILFLLRAAITMVLPLFPTRMAVSDIPEVLVLYQRGVGQL